MHGAVDHEAGRIDVVGRIADLLPLEVDLDEAASRDLLEEPAVRIDEEMFLGGAPARTRA